ncbi:MAG TPA: hypothetical protein VLI05_00435 [Candidatus Saccharimonadia bacterium]|nr:hypothetical protein [Candidatus Saccharimonadia bacterium]
MAKQNDQTKDESMPTAQAGQMNDEKVRDERGAEFFSEIGSQQGKENNPGNFANRPKEEVKAAGSSGGDARGNNADDRASDDDLNLDEAA